MDNQARYKNINRAIAGALAVSIALSPLGNIAYAAAVNLADGPLQAINPVKPNVMYTLDNSGSMQWGSITGQDGTAEYQNGPSTNRRAYFSGDYNGVYYNPAITYTPAVDYLNNPLQNILTLPLLTADVKGNSNPVLARLDPFPTTGGTINILNLTPTCYGKPKSTTDPVLPFYSRTGTYATGFPVDTTNCKALSGSGYTQLYARYAFYYPYTGAAGGLVGNADPASTLFDGLSRVDIIPSVTTYGGTVRANRTDCAAKPNCTYAEEIQNFANWFTYYRTRIQMTKTSLGLAFSQLDGDPTVAPKFRVGFNTINGSSTNNTAVTDGTYWQTIRDFASYTTASPPATAAGASTASQKGVWFTRLYNIMPANSTPLRTQMDRIGKLYQGTLGGFDYTNNDPYFLNNPTDKTLVSCRPSYHIMSTDGFWNDSFSGAGNTDASVPSPYPAPATGSTPTVVGGVTAGGAWPRPYNDTGSGSDTLADVAMKYWINDLRPSLSNNVESNSADPAYWQHMTTFTIGLGANGNLIYQPDYQTALTGDFAAIKAGTKNWPTPTSDQPTTIDDLWHAAVDGHGTYLSAKDPANLTNGLVKILQDITARQASAAGATVSSPNISSTNNTVFAVGYDTLDWSGNIKAFSIDPASGALNTTPLWQANTQLDSQAAGAGWDSNRKIFTKNPSGLGGVPFRLPNLGSPTIFGATSAIQQNVLNYLRGDKSNEGTSPGKFRQRVHVLGDIVGSEVVPIGAPNAPYFENNNKGYAQFKTNNKARAKTVFAAANDGMLHAFDALTGNERWAYVPGIVLDPTRTASSPTSAPLAALTYQPGTVAPIFTHHYYTDATPIVIDVDFATTNGATCATATCDWHTILVAGLNKGGRGFYALDVTDPTAATESAAAGKVLWEFTDGNSADMGFSFGKPIVVKTKKYGWVVIVTSGYNNTSNRSVVYVLDAKTGTKLHQFNAPSGTNNGLAKVSGYTLDITDFTLQQVYGGDLDGNVWRFDMNPSLATWATAPTLFARLRDLNNNVQPVTTEVAIASDPKNNTDRWIFIGTGRYLDSPDSTTPAGYNDSMYAIKDGTKTTTEPTANGLALPVTRAQLVAQTGVNAISIPSVASGKDGWVQDFAAGSGEKVNIDPVAFAGAVAWVTNTPSLDPCSLGVTGKVYVREYSTATSLIVDTAGTRLASLSSDTGFVKIQVVKIGGTVRMFAGTGGAIKNTNAGGLNIGDTSALGTLVCNTCASPATMAIRSNWREILQ